MPNHALRLFMFRSVGWYALPLAALLGCTPLDSRRAPLEGDASLDSGTDASPSSETDSGGSQRDSDGAVTEPRSGRGGKGGKGGSNAAGEGGAGDSGAGEGSAGEAGASGDGAAGAGAPAAGAGGQPVSGAGGEPMAGASGGPAPPMGPCPDGSEPADEACDDKDNDCDGKVDEELSRGCGPAAKGECKPGTETCKAGEWGACSGAVVAKDEACDAASLDENCDGSQNEGCRCIEGAMQACGKNTGLCKAGVQMCVGGNWSAECTGAINPMMPEVCDEAMVDENCDGQKNEGCLCFNGQVKDCTTSALGPCKPGKQSCSSGKWGVCTSTVKSSTEVCDSVDNNCDGTVDNNVSSCKAGFSCVSGECKCTPQCSGKTCGDDGCGGSCAPNSCPASSSCVNGNCKCTPQCSGKTCGDDGCGGRCAPDSCAADFSCVSGNCKCTPQCSGKTCGDDGCGGKCAPNSCPSGQACTSAGQCASSCGNNVVDPGEACDDGTNSETGACPHCQRAFCGDSFIQAGVEECEQNAPGWSSTYCSPSCKRNVYQACDAGVQGTCASEGPNANCASWVSNDPSTETCGAYCETTSGCPAPGGYEAYCAFVYCALLCNNGTCPTGMRCARNVPLGLNPNTVNKDVCLAGG